MIQPPPSGNSPRSEATSAEARGAGQPPGTPGAPGPNANPAGAQGGAQAVADRAQAKAGEVVDQAKETAGRVAGQVQEQATSRLEEQKERAAGGLGSLAQAVRQTGQELRGQEQGAGVAAYADTAAQQIERAASFLRTRDVPQLLDEVEDVAQRQPALFLGGALALGFLGVRFLLSSGDRASRRRRAMEASERTTTPARPLLAPPPRSAATDRTLDSGAARLAGSTTRSSMPSSGVGRPDPSRSVAVPPTSGMGTGASGTSGTSRTSGTSGTSRTTGITGASGTGSAAGGA